MDFNVNTEIKQSEINGLYQEVEELKKQRTRLKDQIDAKTEKIIKHILEHGKVIAYKDKVPHVLLVKNGRATKFDKSKLAHDLDISTRELNLIGIAELVEEKRITSSKLKDYEYEETVQKLKARKATKSDMEIILGGRV